MEFGEQFVITTGATLMPELYVLNLGIPLAVRNVKCLKLYLLCLLYYTVNVL